jgi:flavin reductase (DIM6/NTAB) family NADH-FMN oxidoreductase RutF
MIDQTIKRCLGQMMHGVQVVGASAGGIQRAYCSHWVSQVSFAEPVVMASVSPRHDTYPLIRDSGRFSVSVLAGDQVAVGQYFSYPGRMFHDIATEFLETWHDLPVVSNAIAWLDCSVFETKTMIDHELVFARVESVQGHRLREAPLTYSSRLGWRVAGDKAREAGVSVRDELLARLAAAGFSVDSADDDSADE